MKSNTELNQELQRKLKFSPQDLTANSKGKFTAKQKRLVESLYDLNPGQPSPIPPILSLSGSVQVKKHFRLHGGKPGYDAIVRGQRIAIVRGGRSAFKPEREYRLYYAEFGPPAKCWALLLSAEILPD